MIESSQSPGRPGTMSEQVQYMSEQLLQTIKPIEINSLADGPHPCIRFGAKNYPRAEDAIGAYERLFGEYPGMIYRLVKPDVTIWLIALIDAGGPNGIEADLPE